MVETPSWAEVIGPMVEPHGMSPRAPNSCIGTPAWSHASRNQPAETASVA